MKAANKECVIKPATTVVDWHLIDQRETKKEAGFKATRAETLLDGIPACSGDQSEISACGSTHL